MRGILRAYFARWKLRHVDEDAFREVAEEVSRRDLKGLFAEWLHATPLFDYRLERVDRDQLPDRHWRTRVTIALRTGCWKPAQIAHHDTNYPNASREPEDERRNFRTCREPR